MSNRKVIELLLQLKSAKAYGKNYIKVKSHLVRHLQRNFLLTHLLYLNNLFQFVVSGVCWVCGSKSLDYFVSTLKN